MAIAPIGSVWRADTWVDSWEQYTWADALAPIVGPPDIISIDGRFRSTVTMQGRFCQMVSTTAQIRKRAHLKVEK